MSEDAMCCPLSDCDDALPEFFRSYQRRAAKRHACCECEGLIVVGEPHEYASGMNDGWVWSNRTCLLCVEIREHFVCGAGYIYGRLWEDLRERFLPDMRLGGPCMEGLSARAKAELRDQKLRHMGLE